MPANKVDADKWVRLKDLTSAEIITTVNTKVTRKDDAQQVVASIAEIAGIVRPISKAR